jgi:hypothetical protein
MLDARTCIVLDGQLALWQLVQQQALDAHLLLLLLLLLH